MNQSLEHYKQLVGTVETSADIEDMITYGDWMALVTYRTVLDELKDNDNFNEQERNDLWETDQILKEYITAAQLGQLAYMEPNLPIKKWWGEN